MIDYVRGSLVEKAPARAVIEAGGVGYEFLIPLSTYDRLGREGAQQKLFAYHSVREDDETLFGFATKAEREFFTKLISVAGVGPKMAVAILSGGSTGELSLAIAAGNAKRIASVKGVGKKTAEKICIELKDKVCAIEALAEEPGAARTAAPAGLHDAVLALTALGFSDETANKMVSHAVSENPGVSGSEELVRLALQGKKR